MTKLKTTDAAFCIGSTVKAVRHWVGRGQIAPFADVRPGNGKAAWFSRTHLCFTKLFAILVTFGTPVREASDLVANAYPWDAIRADDDAGLSDEELLAKWWSQHLIVMTRGGRPDRKRRLARESLAEAMKHPVALIIPPKNAIGEALARAAKLRERRAS